MLCRLRRPNMLSGAFRRCLRRINSPCCSFSVSSSSFSTSCSARSFPHPFSLRPPPRVLDTSSKFSFSYSSAFCTIDRYLSTTVSSSESVDSEDFEEDLLTGNRSKHFSFEFSAFVREKKSSIQPNYWLSRIPDCVLIMSA